MLRTLVAALLALSACSTDADPMPDTAPTVLLVISRGVAEVDGVVAGARAWEELGFAVEIAGPSEPGGARECGPRWYATGDLDCTVTILVRPDEPQLHAPGVWAYSIRETRDITIRTDIVGAQRRAAAAHEVGHVLLDVGNAGHLEVDAVMSSGGVRLAPTDADRDLAARSIGWPW